MNKQKESNQKIVGGSFICLLILFSVGFSFLSGLIIAIIGTIAIRKLLEEKPEIKKFVPAGFVIVIVLIFGVIFKSYQISFDFLGVSIFSDASNQQRYWGEYVLNKEYVLTRDIFLISEEDGNLILIPEASFKNMENRQGGRHNWAPNSIDKYLANPNINHYQEYLVEQVGYDQDTLKSRLSVDPSFLLSEKVLGVVRKGTIIKVIQFEKLIGFNIFVGYGAGITPYALILDGKFRNTKVNITDISVYYQQDDKGPFIYRPEKGLLSLKE